MVSQASNIMPATMWYAGRKYGWGVSMVECMRGGGSWGALGFRLACKMNFDC